MPEVKWVTLTDTDSMSTMADRKQVKKYYNDNPQVRTYTDTQSTEISRDNQESIEKY